MLFIQPYGRFWCDTANGTIVDSTAVDDLDRPQPVTHEITEARNGYFFVDIGQYLVYFNGLMSLLLSKARSVVIEEVPYDPATMLETPKAALLNVRWSFKKKDIQVNLSGMIFM